MSIILPLLFSLTVNGQETELPDTIPDPELVFPNDTLEVKGKLAVSPDAVDLPIVYKAEGYMKTDLRTKKVSLVEKAQVNYGTIELTADSIVLDMETGEVYATGRLDSAGVMVGKPHFRDGSEDFESKELNYNFKSQKGVIRNVVTEQEGGFLQSVTTKRQEDGTLHVNKSKFTTCDAEEPHFYMALNRAKVYPGEKIVSGPAYLVVADIPLPLILPFGFFPVQQSRSSGIIMPRYGQEARRGYYLSNGGYYFALNDYFDLKMTGTAYTNGTWLVDGTTTYKVRYRFSGNFGFSYANNITSYKGLPDYSKTTNYSLKWSHAQDAKSNPGSRFSASVNMSSMGYDKENSYEVADHVTTTRQSSVSYSKTWSGTPFNFSSSLNHSQNVQTGNVQVNLPKASFNVSRIYPFKPKKAVAKQRWYHDLQTQYSAALDNKLNTYDSILFTSQAMKNMENGFKHDIPVSVQIRPFNNFSISPQVRYAGVLYSQKIEKHWDPDYYDETKNEIVPSVVNDTIRGIFYGQAITPSISASFNPQLYGTYQITKKDSRIESFRHVMRPSVGFSYAPEADFLASDMFRTVQYDTLGNTREYSIYQNNIFGTPSQGTRSGSVSLSLANIVEAKVYARDDTTGKPKKIKIIESLNFNTSYNIFQDSLNWSPISASFRTVLAENINFQANSSFTIYGMNANGATVSDLAIQQGLGLVRMTNLNVSVDLDVARLLSGKDDAGQQSSSGNALRDPEGGPSELSGSMPLVNNNLDEYGYVQFDVPWSLRMAYNFNYSKPGITSSITQTLTLAGDIKLTPKTAINYTTGYDFKQNEITMTRVGISRDLHCWEMSFSWIPIGYMRSWGFTIRPKAGLLQDLKYERRKDYHENY